jgi:hypothetical protein
MAAKRTSGSNPPDWFRSAEGGGSREANARKQSPGGKVPGPRRSLNGSRSDTSGSTHCIAERSRDRGVGVPAKNILVHVGRHIRRSCSLPIVLCQGESGSGASLGACDGSNTSCCVRPVVRLMSDRESVSVASTPRFGF